MKSFEVEVIVTNKYKIEIDENVVNEKWLKDFNNTFVEIDSIKDHAENLAKQRAGGFVKRGDFIEGYGKVRIMKGLYDTKDWEKVVDGISIKILSEDEDIDVFFL